MTQALADPTRLRLAAFAADFAPDRDYAKAEVNAVITRRFDDYCTVRRELVDDRLLSRAAEAGTPPHYSHTGEVDVRPLPLPGSGGNRAGPGTCAGASITNAGTSDAMDNNGSGAVRPDLRRRKEWIELYKQARKAAGVYCVRNATSGRVLLGSSVNLHGPLNRHRSELKIGSHRCLELQADWNSPASRNTNRSPSGATTRARRSACGRSDRPLPMIRCSLPRRSPCPIAALRSCRCSHCWCWRPRHCLPPPTSARTSPTPPSAST